MKNRILSAIVITLVLVSCNQKSKQEEPLNSETNNVEVSKVKVNPNSFSIKEIISNYLLLKNALTEDDSKVTADAAKGLVEILGKMDMTKLSGEQMKTYMDIADATKEYAAHIADNTGNLDTQRAQFVLLSKAINDLVQNFGSEQKLFQDFCPMADEGKGAIWISEVKEIKNPYFGSEMLSCGSVRKEF